VSEENIVTSLFGARATTLNAKISAIALAAASLAILLLSHFGAPLSPVRLLSLALVAFAIWAFCDEMGIHKPLNRAGFIFFTTAMLAKTQTILGVSNEVLARYYLLYATSLLSAILLWSVAFLHREQTLKILGTVGIAGSVATLALLVAGHLAVGVGAMLGVGALLEASSGTAPTDISFVSFIERMFGLWGYATAWLLWRGHIQQPSKATT
jgi:hypothetical protein